jgi:hypothetical protein
MHKSAPLLILSLVLCWPSHTPVFAIDHYEYIERTGTSRTVFSWEMNGSQEITIRVKQGQTVFVNHCDRSGATFQWKFQNAASDIHVDRLGNKLHMTGITKGQKVNRIIQLDDSPWYQPLSYSFRNFLASNRSSTLFWIIRSDNLKAIKMKAEKDGIEEIQVGDDRFESHKIRVSPHGLAGYLWSGKYWYRVSDGLFLKYRGTKGMPGTPETVVELLPPNQLQEPISSAKKNITEHRAD